MADDDSPDNVLQMPRIGSPTPPPVPAPPTLDGDQDHPAADDGVVRISAFDAPAVPHAPPPPDPVPAVLRSDGLDAPQSLGDAGPPRTGALSLAAILAIALAAFEGLQSWIQESGPRRAEAAAHQRELELLAAKATADATRHHAEADREHARGRRVPSSHDYGRSALGRGPGGAGRGAGGIGPGRGGTGRTGPHNGSTQHRSGAGIGGRPSTGTGRSDGHGVGPDSRRNGPGSRRNGPGAHRNGPGSDRNSSLRDRKGGRGSRNDGGSRRKDGSGSSGGNSARGPAGAGGRGSAGTGGSGRRSARRAVADWWGKEKKKPDGTGSGAKGSGGKGSKGGSGAADTKAALRKAVKHSKPGPTFWEKAGDRLEDRWRKRRSNTDAPTTAAGGRRDGAKRRSTGNDGWTPPGDRGRFREAVFDAVNDRWKKRRERWTADGGPRPKPNPSRGRGRSDRTTDPGPPSDPGPRTPGPHGPGAHPGYGQARSSPFDADTGPDVVITVEQVDPPGAHAKRWEPGANGPSLKGLPVQSQPALPRAPQRPAGPRPGTTRRKDPIPMPAASSGAVTPMNTSVGMVGEHLTEITLDDVLKVLSQLTTDGMETYDDAVNLAGLARKLLAELDQMTDDLARTHNVSGPRTKRAIAGLMESVADMTATVERLAQAALAAAEGAEAEETAMARDYRPTQDATADAGLHTPSARIHNEN
ncbi:hypothetical protein ACFTWN_30750 [Streptomyces sp. NPDC057092]|uniref:hypothetical protein n=1 Tax=Streptomyces sp. NPDC057092 TaxID=3346017 RepID=UPI00363C4BF5